MPKADITMKCNRCTYEGTPAEFIHDAHMVYERKAVAQIERKDGRLWSFFTQVHITYKCPRCGQEQGLNWRDDV